MIRIGCISDTHIPVAAARLPQTVFETFEDVDLILHAGDILGLSVIAELEKLAPVHAVSGNMDHADTIHMLPDKKIIDIGGFKIGLIHGSGSPTNLIARIKQELPKTDCIVYGHTHQAVVEEIDGIYYLNPGSPTDKRFASVNTLGILEVSDTLKGRIILL